MENADHNLLDLLDELRDLPAEEQSRRLADLPEAIRAELEKCLKFAPGAGNTLEPMPRAEPKYLMGEADESEASRVSVAVTLESVVKQLADSGIIPPESSMILSRPGRNPKRLTVFFGSFATTSL